MTFSSHFYENVHSEKMIRLHLSLRPDGENIIFKILNKRHNLKMKKAMLSLSTIYSNKDISNYCNHFASKKMQLEKALMSVGFHVAIGTVEYQNKIDLDIIDNFMKGSIAKEEAVTILARLTAECKERKINLHKIQKFISEGNEYKNPIIEF